MFGLNIMKFAPNVLMFKKNGALVLKKGENARIGAFWQSDGY